jgi:hypothetical protein
MIFILGLTVIYPMVKEKTRFNTIRSEAEEAAVNQQEEKSRYQISGSDNMYRFAEDSLSVSLDGGKSWLNRKKKLPPRIVYPFDQEHYLPVHEIGINPDKPWNIVLCSRNKIYTSSNFGAAWTEQQTAGQINQNTYFTSASLSPSNPDAIIAGTSFEGIYETKDRGETWIHVSKGMDLIDQGAGFDNEISGIAYDPVYTNTVYFSLGFGNGLYLWDRENNTIKGIETPENGFGITSLQFWRYTRTQEHSFPLKKRSVLPGKWLLEVDTDNSRWIFNPENNEWTEIGIVKKKSQRKESAVTASNREGIYVPGTLANPRHLPRFLKYIKENNLDSIIVDLKDDYGKLTYDTDLELAHAMGGVNRMIDMEYLVDWCKENNIYLIARLVIFKDKVLFSYNNWRYTLLDSRTGRPWAFYRTYTDEETGEEKLYQSEYWVDPYSEFVWDYNIRIAEELQSLGVDEIQYDYIRFPSDGDVEYIVSRYRRAGMDRVDALASFLKKSKEKITIPISTDVYGFNAWAKMGYLGQDIMEISKYLDVICPMFYPSHFPIHFLPELPYLEKAKMIYQRGTIRAHAIVKGRSYIRPYIQSFLLGKHEEFDKRTASLYFHNQIAGSSAGMGSGFSLWNAAGKYNMNSQSLAAFTLDSGKEGAN